MKATCLLALLLGLCVTTSCESVNHFPGPDQRYDNLYFGPWRDASDTRESAWRIYAVLGFITYSDEARTWAGETLAKHANDRQPRLITVTTSTSFLNSLAEIGISLVPLLGNVRPFVYVPRLTSVSSSRMDTGEAWL